MNELIYFVLTKKNVHSISLAHITKYLQNSYIGNLKEICEIGAFRSGANVTFRKTHHLNKK